MRRRRGKSWFVKWKWDLSSTRLTMDLIWERWTSVWSVHFITSTFSRLRLSVCTPCWTPALTGLTSPHFFFPSFLWSSLLFFYRLDIFEFLSHVQDGLKDHYDIKMLTYLMVARWPPLIWCCPCSISLCLSSCAHVTNVTVHNPLQGVPAVPWCCSPETGQVHQWQQYW